MPVMDTVDAKFETFEILFAEAFSVIDNPTGDGKILDGFSLDKPVRFYGYKQRSDSGDKDEVQRPAVILAQVTEPDGSVPQVAIPDLPFIARCGAMIVIECPIGYEAGGADKGGRDNLLQPIAAAIQEWIKDNPALEVPPEVRYDTGAVGGNVVYKPELIDLRRSRPFITSPRRINYEATIFNIVLETLEVT